MYNTIGLKFFWVACMLMIQTGIYAAEPKVYAVVVGISKYKDVSLKLEYADKDAELFAGFLKSPSGGSIPPDQIRLLTNEKASRQNVLDAIEKFSVMATKNDVFILYYAGHGTNVTFNNNFFLMTYDTDAQRVSSTATPASQINASLTGSAAKMKFWITDACNAGRINEPGTRAVKKAPSGADMYLKKIAESYGGYVYISSTQSQEVSVEHARFGGGHGAFSYFLVEGLRGKADEDKDGIITVNEAFDYVRSKVIKYTTNQHPNLSDMYFDGKFPMASTQPGAKNLHTARATFNSLSSADHDHEILGEPVNPPENDDFSKPELKGGNCSYSSQVIEDDGTMGSIVTFSSIGEKGKLVQIIDTLHRNAWLFNMKVNVTDRNAGEASLIFNPRDQIQLYIYHYKNDDINDFYFDLVYMANSGKLYYQRASPSQQKNDFCLKHNLSKPLRYSGKLINPK